MSGPTENDLRVYDAMMAALEMLDSGQYPADIGAHLDLAICRLREHVGIAPIEFKLDFGSEENRLAS